MTLRFRIDALYCKEFEVVEMNVSQFAIKYAKLYKEKSILNGSKERLIFGACKTNLKKTIKKEYKKFLLKKVLTNSSSYVLIDGKKYINSNYHGIETKFPASSINDFSLQYFGDKIDINFVYKFTKDLDYSKYFIKNLNRNEGIKIEFRINNLTDGVVQFHIEKMYESAFEMFEEFIKPHNLFKEEVIVKRKKI